ncbi:Cytochrome c domain-containing protein [Bordetella sputigena]|uniref:c-type cytochrome n=1 Tax=Bordetella sputigena TaxID=1416810 RepID=UPI0039EEC229
MNQNMAALVKGATMVGGSFVLLVAIVSGLFHIPQHREKPPGPPAGGVAGSSAPAPVTPPQASAPGAPAQQGSAPGAAGAPSAAAAQQPQTPPRKATDFTFPQARFEQVLAQNADAPVDASLANSGKPSAGVAACASCHGAQGVPAAGTPFPILAGAPPAYVAKQLLDYRDGTRQHPIMTGIAKGLDDKDIAAVARYYGSLPAPAIKPPAANAQDRGQRLHGFGDNGLALAACANCHGANGEGEAPMLPRLAAQPEAYIAGQLDAFRNGQRANDDLGTMRDIAKRLSAEDTAALAKYYAGMRSQ